MTTQSNLFSFFSLIRKIAFTVILYYSIEDDFITWKDKFWPAVCEYFGIESTGEEEMIRQYRLLEPMEIPMDRIYTGEIARLHSYRNQRPLVFIYMKLNMNNIMY